MEFGFVRVVPEYLNCFVPSNYIYLHVVIFVVHSDFETSIQVCRCLSYFASLPFKKNMSASSTVRLAHGRCKRGTRLTVLVAGDVTANVLHLDAFLHVRRLHHCPLVWQTSNYFWVKFKVFYTVYV
jgi:hypothetical protein